MWRFLRLLFAVVLEHICLGVAPEKRLCKVLLLVAHADDEILFAGEALLGRKVRFDCYPAWHIVVATGSSPERVEEFWRVLDILRSSTLSTGITGEVWDYEDCNFMSCDLFPGKRSFKGQLIEVMQQDQWDFVVTHNLQGEYHHKQHIGLFNAVEELFKERPDVVGSASFWVFNPLPEFNTSVSNFKMNLLKEYFLSSPTMARGLTFNTLSKFTEHLVPAKQFARPTLLGAGFTQETLLQIGIPFWYSFIYMPGAIHLTAAEMYGMLKEYFMKTWNATCNTRGFVRYPETCRSLLEQSHKIDPYLGRALAILEVAKLSEWTSVSIPEKPKGPASLRCLTGTRLKSFGKITRWEAETQFDDGGYVELLALRPIWVGWKQGKQNTYKILGSSGPIWVGQASKYVLQKQNETISVQPGDVVGWGRFDQTHDTSSFEVAMGTSEACIGARGCEKADFCSFDSVPPKELLRNHVRKVSPIVERNSPKPARQQKYFKVMKALDISKYVNVNSTYEELLTLRQRLDDPDLGIFEDKIRLRRELLPAAGVLATPSIHLSNDDFDIARFLKGRKNYVVKPSHMSESQNVFVVQDGMNLLRMAWGHPPQVYIQEIQDAVNSFSKKTALEWECQALVSSKPGVIVEELVLATKAENPGKYLVDEYKFYTSWGRTIVAENIPFSSGAVMEISRTGQILTTKADCPPFCVAACFPQMVQIAEKVATHARTDFLRVDILVSGDCENLFVSEVELFPASDFSQILKDAVAERWRRGYGVR